MRKLFFPFSILYGFITIIRNKLFDFGILKVEKFSIPIIGIGNLSTGGTGKSPHVLYVANLLESQYRIAILSRGFGRRTKGYREVQINDSAQQSGDEPLQYKHFLPDAKIVVCEKRVIGITEMSSSINHLDVIIMDDSFQHRYVKPGLNIIITAYDTLFYNDFLLPAGNLRETKSSVKRADAVVVSKTNVAISKIEMDEIALRIKSYGILNCFFSYIHYREELLLFNGGILTLNELAHKSVLLLAGIANPNPLEKYLSEHCIRVQSEIFNDHHNFTVGDITNLKKKFDKFAMASDAIIVTTRKDAMRLMASELIMLVKNLPVAIIDIDVNFHSYGSISFDQYIQNYVKTNSRVS